MSKIQSTEAARALGAIRSAKKAASSRRNLAKARATTAAALEAYKAAQDGEAKSVTLAALKTAVVRQETIAPTLLIGKSHHQRAADELNRHAAAMKEIEEPK